MKQFKVGDKVYCPHFSTGILTLVQSEKSNNLLAFEHCNKLIDITKDGKIWDSQGLVADIFHATEENHALLERLYGIDFEQPSILKSPKEIIQAMLDSKKYKYGIFCYVSQVSYENAILECNSKFIWEINDEGFVKRHHTAGTQEVYKFAVPIKFNSGGKRIIDFNPETGEIVLDE